MTARTAVPLVALAALLAGCSRPWDDAPDLIDTGWFPDEDGLCPAAVQSTVPADGDTGWYWRDPLTVLVGAPSDAFVVRLVDDGGAELPTSVQVDETGLRQTVTPTEGLRPSTLHRLQLTDCRGTREVVFTTSELGAPLTDGAESLSRRTWRLDLVNGDWLQPGGFGAVLAGLVDMPILVGTTFVDAGHLDMLGAVGRSNGAVIVQEEAWPTWDLPLGDFDDAPYFATHADRVVWAISEWPLPIEDFALAGTFAPDGASIGGMVLTGVVDTRGVGGAIGADGDEDAICAFAEGLGVACIPCADGEPLCLQAEVRSMTAVEQPGVALKAVRD